MHIGARDTRTETRIAIGERDNAMTVAFRRYAVNEIDEPVFEPAHGEAKHNMRDHRTAILWLGRYHRVFLISFRAVSIAGQASAANAASIASLSARWAS